MENIWRTNIINRDPRRISEEQYSLLVDVIRQMMSIPQYSSIIRTIFANPRSPYKITITNGVHYHQYDHLGPYHFNIQIGTNQTQHHVYVEPVPIEDPVFLNPDQSVQLRSTVQYRWQLITVTDS